MIKFSIPNIQSSDIKIVSKIIKSGWLTHGNYTSLFEKEFKKFQSLSMQFLYQAALLVYIFLV